MSLWSRVWNVFRGDRLNRDLNEEFESHLEEAIAAGRDPEEARRAFGSLLRQREAARGVLVWNWADGLRADVVLGLRQLRRNRATSAVAVLSLALAMGACVSAFRLIDALLWRPLPIAEPGRLFAISRAELSFEGKPRDFDGWAYPDFELMRAAAKDNAELIAVSYADHMDLTYASDDEMEKGLVQYVSGGMWESFGLRPALGRLFTEQEDRVPGADPVAVLSYDYWSRRFGRDPKVIGRTIRLGDQLLEIVGVGPKSFTGTEPGTMTEIFLPIMLNRWVKRDDATWHRTFAVVRPGAELEPLRARLDAVSMAFERERAKGFKGMPQQSIDNYLHQRVELLPASSGASGMQQDYHEALACLGALVVLVLLIACVNVANLMTALAAARAREMALRVSIGAGRWRLVQMVLVESAILAGMAGSLGAVMAWQAAPLVLRMVSSPDNAVRLVLPADWRVLSFSLVLVTGVTLLFGLLPALRASAVRPVSALKGGNNPHGRHRMMYGMIAVQVAICFLVVFISGLFVTTFDRLERLPLGFSPKGLLLLESVAPHGKMPEFWSRVAETLQARPGVEKVAESGWPMMSSSWNDSVAIDGGAPSVDLVYFLTVSPGWFGTMQMQMISGRDFLPTDVSPGAAVVNQTFVKLFFPNENPVGRFFERADDDGTRVKFQVAGVVADAPYRSVREPQLPVAFVPLREVDAKGVVQLEANTTFLVRLAAQDQKALMARAGELRKAVAASGAGIRVSNVQTQQELIDGQTVRERLLAMLGVFFASVALLLAGIGLYGVLNYSALQRRREIGIRIAVGARSAAIVQLVTGSVVSMVAVGVVAGIGLGLVLTRSIESLFFRVKATDATMMALPVAVILVVTGIAVAPGVLRALQIDPVEILRTE
ncbi:ADOP family duplicated permease [Silvibacterium acidisoli]|uniref:ADOP family duplicated permease n=1 Tax=Acidobacteriaceae bacterium ZG23-2 TaxID=2883246 RepID=UPI00406BFFB0